MKLQFKNQKYQEDAALSVVNLFISQNNNEYRKLVDRAIKNKGTLIEEMVDVYSYGNNLINIDESTLRQNIKTVQKENNLDMTEDKNFTDKSYYKNFSIEMETGTGKTYTYIKTMYELNKAYGFSKFIVMVPSIAIREGTLKSFQITEEHFKEQYGKKIRYFKYNSNDSSNLANIKSFSEDSNINVMIINYAAFNRDIDVKDENDEKRLNKIFRKLDELQSRRPIDIIKETNPILILDEPQKMGDKAEKGIYKFNPLFTLRYSATHKPERIYNLVYRIDAVDAYNKRLVKKIGVIGCEVDNDKSTGAYIYLSEVEIGKGEPRAHIEMEVKSGKGTRKVMKWVKKGDRLYDLSDELNAYKGYVVSEIDYSTDIAKITFSNGEVIKTNELIGSNEDKILARNQIRQTILTHFEKEQMLFERGIKVLSLFFIDEVAKYKIYDDNNVAQNGEYADTFEEIYNEIYEEKLKENKNTNYGKYLFDLKNKKVHSGYFSIDKKKSKKGELYYIDSKVDKKTGESDDPNDSYAFDLIMKDKERLLSFDEPVRFIFSHSALREG